MNRIALILAVVVVALACQKKADLLQLTVEPLQPIIIPAGKTTVNGKEISAPWYTINSITLNWNTDNRDDGVAQVLAIIIKSKFSTGGTVGQGTDFTCAVDGDLLYTMFPSNGAGRIIIGRNEPRTSKTGFICSGFTLPSPVPEQFNVPTTVKVYAAQVADNNYYKTMARATTTARIILK